MRGSSRLLWVALSVCLALVTVVNAQTIEDKVQEFTLDNGMTFLVVERHEAPVFFGAVAFKVGSVYERPGITGISHLLEHMLFKGTETIGTTDYKKEIPYLEREDELAEAARDLRRELEPWRLEFFQSLADDVIEGFSEEDREVLGADRALELELLVERLSDVGPTDEMLNVFGLVRQGGVDHFEQDYDYEISEDDIGEGKIEEKKKQILKKIGKIREMSQQHDAILPRKKNIFRPCQIDFIPTLVFDLKIRSVAFTQKFFRNGAFLLLFAW